MFCLQLPEKNSAIPHFPNKFHGFLAAPGDIFFRNIEKNTESNGSQLNFPSPQKTAHARPEKIRLINPQKEMYYRCNHPLGMERHFFQETFDVKNRLNIIFFIFGWFM